jgi:hypothetical protein
MVEFANKQQMFNYLQNVLGRQLWYDNHPEETFWKTNILLKYVQVQLIRGLTRSCDYLGRPDFTDRYANSTCVSTYSRFFGEWNTSDHIDSIYAEKKGSPVGSRGMIDSYPERGTYKTFGISKD